MVSTNSLLLNVYLLLIKPFITSLHILKLNLDPPELLICLVSSGFDLNSLLVLF